MFGLYSTIESMSLVDTMEAMLIARHFQMDALAQQYAEALIKKMNFSNFLQVRIGQGTNLL